MEESNFNIQSYVKTERPLRISNRVGFYPSFEAIWTRRLAERGQLIRCEVCENFDSTRDSLWQIYAKSAQRKADLDAACGDPNTFRQAVSQPRVCSMGSSKVESIGFFVCRL